MKQKIERFANGIFTYESPVIEISEESLYINAISGKKHEGSFVVHNSNSTKIRGFVSSSCDNISFPVENFEGTDNEIAFVFDATFLEAGTEIATVINIVSDCGEARINVNVNVGHASISTSLGNLSDIFHFINLAMGNTEEARELFKSEAFKNVVIKNSPGFGNLYRSLVGAPNTSQALEEFLIASRKKKIVEFQIDCDEINYDSVETAFVDKIAIRKTNWGFAQIKCDVAGDFIEAERSLIWSEDFENGVFWLKYSINPDRMRQGKNYGTITLSTIAESVVIPVNCRLKTVETGRKLTSKLKRDEYTLKLMRSIIDYKLNRTGSVRYAADTENILAIMRSLRAETVTVRLYGAYIAFMSENKKKATEIFESLSTDPFLEQNTEAYALSLMVEALISEDTHVYNDNLNAIRQIYDNEHNLNVLLMVFELDDRYRMSKRARLEAIAECFNEGLENSLALVEAAKILTEDPMVLKKLETFEIMCLKTAIKYGMMNISLALQVAYLAGREKQASKLLMSILKSLYASTGEKALLEPICIQLVNRLKEDGTEFENGHLVGTVESAYTQEEIFHWLSLGAENQLRINGIYEYCLKVSDTWSKPLPKMLTTYFAAGITLNDRDKAALFANIVKFNKKDDSVYTLFRNVMEMFAYSSLSQGEMSRELAVLYNEFLEPDKLDEKQIMNLPKIMFANEITTDWKKMTSVAVYHKEMRNPEIIPARNGRVIADLYTEDAVIVLLDDEGNRVVASFNIDVRKLMNRSDLMKLMREKCTDNIRVMLNGLEENRLDGRDDISVSLIARYVDFNGMDEQFLMEGRLELIDYYYENQEGELLESLLVQINLAELGSAKRSHMIELMIYRELYSLALKNMEIYGYDGVTAKRLNKLCSTLITLNSSQVSSKLFVQICHYCFLKKSYDDNILKFLIKNFNGTTQELYDVWKEAHNIGIDTTDIEERLIRTALYTENDMLFVRDVFIIYYGHCSSGKLVRAYLSYLAYGCLVKENYITREILDIMKREANYSENDICMLVILKDYSRRKSFTEQEKSYINFQMEKMEMKGLLMPFFKDFPQDIKIPKEMKDKYYVEYHTDQSKRVRIHYNFCNGDQNANFVEEDMKNIAYGIYVKEFVLFYGEILQYFITEVGDEQNVITESREVSLEPEVIGGEENRYHQLNLIITAKEMNDEKTVVKLIETYMMNDYIVKRLFSPINK